MTGDPPRGSWWSHSRGREIFAVLTEMADRDDVLFTKLIGGKVTLVHRRLWPALAAVGAGRERWQLGSLSRAAAALLRRVNAASDPLRASGPAPKELETRLLVVARQVHTEEGRHETAVQCWDAWRAEARCRRLRSPAGGRKALEAAAARLGAPAEALPWNASRHSRRKARPRGRG